MYQLLFLFKSPSAACTVKMGVLGQHHGVITLGVVIAPARLPYAIRAPGGVVCVIRGAVYGLSILLLMKNTFTFYQTFPEGQRF